MNALVLYSDIYIIHTATSYLHRQHKIREEKTEQSNGNPAEQHSALQTVVDIARIVAARVGQRERPSFRGVPIHTRNQTYIHIMMHIDVH